MKAKTLSLLEKCIDDGIEAGYTKAFKHVKDPSPGYIQQSIYDAIMLEIHDWFDFEELN